MKQILTTLIIPLAIGLIVAYFAFNLNKETIDLRYTISEKIPTKYVESSTAETVQQLVVKNTGNIPAEKIQIKINGVINEYDILKNSVADKVEEHNSAGHFESIYPSLPPGAQFSYIFKTTGMGLTKSSIEITHNKGKATEALSSDTASLASNTAFFAFLALIIFYLVLLVTQVRSMAIDHLESRGSYTGFYEYLSRTKPFYVSQDKWNSIRRQYIEKKSKLEYFYSSDIEKLESYKILTQDKPDYLSLDEWELLKEMTTKCLVDYLTYSIKTSSIFDNLSKYFTIKKPKYFPDNQWKEIVEEINKNYLVLKKLNKGYSLTAGDIIKELDAGMPNGMSHAYWDQYKEYLLKRYYEIIYRDILREINPINFLNKVNVSILNEEEQERLNSLAYKIELVNFDNISSIHHAEEFLEKEKPEWVTTEDLSKLENKAKSYVEHEKSIKKYQALLNALEDIANLVALKEKPNDAIDDKEWDKITDLEKKISSVAIKIEEDKERLETEKQKTQELKSKVLKQLAIINDTLDDPKSIDRIESYDNPFSEGNFINLQSIANLLKKQNIT